MLWQTRPWMHHKPSKATFFTRLCIRNTISKPLDRATLSAITGLRVVDPSLYEQAFTHKSASAKNSNERLEFVGDSVLNLVVSRHLYFQHPDEDEGFLTSVRIRVVNGKTLARIAQQLELSRFVRMNEKGMRNNWHENPRIMEDTVEALIGAIYLDLGLDAAATFIHTHLLSNLNTSDLLTETNYKDQMIRWAKQDAQQLVYELVEDKGSGADRFQVALSLHDSLLAKGTGALKKDAEQNAAKHALTCLGLLTSD